MTWSTAPLVTMCFLESDDSDDSSAESDQNYLMMKPEKGLTLPKPVTKEKLNI